MANFINTLFGRVINMENQMSKLENQVKNKTTNTKTNYSNYWRTIDGSGNNLSNPDWGMANTQLLRQASPDYADGSSSLAVRGVNNPNPRIVSNLLCKTGVSIPDPNGISDHMWLWGQFIDHLLDLTPSQSSGGESANMTTPTVMQDPNEDFPDRTILFNRSQFIANSDPRQHSNIITSYIDASNVYGSSTTRAYALRRLDGSGKLLTTLANNGESLMPYNTLGLPNAIPDGSTAADFFLAGDERSNENIFLTAMHTLFVREHNRLCNYITNIKPEYINQDEVIFQYARKLVGGIMQYITYNEFLPILLGNNAIPEYTGYQNDVDAGVKTEFSTVAYRIGHTMLSSTLKTGSSGTVLLRDAFFTPSFVQTNGINQLLLGAKLNVMQKIDTRIVEDVRSFLFGPPTAMNLLDLAAINMQRGRDHGIPAYNDLRQAYGLNRLTNFTQITTDTTISNGLASLYNSVDDIDPWIAGLAEDHLTGANVGPLFNAIIKDQFVRARDGDRFYYKNDPSLTKEDIALIEGSTLGKVIERNTNLTNVGDAFHV